MLLIIIYRTYPKRIEIITEKTHSKYTNKLFKSSHLVMGMLLLNKVIKYTYIFYYKLR